MYRKEDINFHEQCSLINIIEPSRKLYIYHDIIHIYINVCVCITLLLKKKNKKHLLAYEV